MNTAFPSPLGPGDVFLEPTTGSTATTFTGEVRHLTLLDENTSPVTIQPSPSGGLAINTAAGQPVTVPNLAVGDDLVVADRARVGGSLRVESNLDIPTDGFEGEGVLIFDTPALGGVVECYNYDTPAQGKLTLKGSEVTLQTPKVTLDAPLVNSTATTVTLPSVAVFKLGSSAAISETATPVRISLGATIAAAAKTPVGLKLALFEDPSVSTYGFTVAPPVDGSDRHSLEYHTNNPAGYHSKHSFIVNGFRHFEVDIASAAGETSMIVYCQDTLSLKRVMTGPSGSGPGGVGRALYIV